MQMRSLIDTPEIQEQLKTLIDAATSELRAQVKKEQHEKEQVQQRLQNTEAKLQNTEHKVEELFLKFEQFTSTLHPPSDAYARVDDDDNDADFDSEDF